MKGYQNLQLPKCSFPAVSALPKSIKSIKTRLLRPNNASLFTGTGLGAALGLTKLGHDIISG
jgi:hypothetical protein